MKTSQNKFHYFKLKDLIDLERGKRTDYIENGKYPVFGAGEKAMGYCNEYNNEGNITITRKGTIGNIYKRKFKHFVTDASNIIVVKNKKIIEVYLYEWLLSKEYLIKQLSKPMLIPELDEKAFMNLEINVPNLEDQKKVVDILNRYRFFLEENNKHTLQLINSLENYRSGVRNMFFEILGEKNE